MSISLLYLLIILFFGHIIASVPKEKFCFFDFECSVVKANCCGCQMGGSSTAVNWLYKRNWESNIEKNCGNVGWLAVYLCINVKPTCEQNNCQFKYKPNNPKLNP